MLPLVRDQLRLLRFRTAEDVDDLTLARVVHVTANAGIAKGRPEGRLTLRPHICDVLVRPGLRICGIRIAGPVREVLHGDHGCLRPLPVTSEHVFSDPGCAAWSPSTTMARSMA